MDQQKPGPSAPRCSTLREIAERNKEYTVFQYVERGPKYVNGACPVEFAALSKAWLEEHPADDDEAVTDEWLLSLGFTSPTGVDYYWTHQLTGYITCERGQWVWQRMGRTIVNLDCRRDVRNIMRAFKLEA